MQRRGKKTATDQTLEGATAVCAWFLKDIVIVANIGDARAVLARETLPEGNHESTGEAAGADGPASKRYKLDTGENPAVNKKDATKLKSAVVSSEHKALNTEEVCIKSSLQFSSTAGNGLFNQNKTKTKMRGGGKLET